MSTDANLTALTPGAGTLAPVFASGTFIYSASVSNPNATVTFAPVASNANALIEVRVNSGPYSTVASGSPSAPLALNVGANTVDVRVTAQDGVTVQTYATAVTRRSAFQDWALANGVPADPTATGANGLSNLMNFAFGLNPNGPGSGTLVLNGTFAGGGSITANGQPITMMQPTANGVDFRALYVRRKDYAAAGLGYATEFSGTLASWATSGAIPAVLADDGTYQIVSVPYPPLVAGKMGRFFRVRITQTP